MSVPPIIAQPPRGAVAHHGPGGLALVIAGTLAGLLALALVAAAAVGLWLTTQRDGAGYISTDRTTYSTGTYALVSDGYRAGTARDVIVPADVLGRIRLRATSRAPVFIGIGPATAVDDYLGGVARQEVPAFDHRATAAHVADGTAPAGPPTAQRFWAASQTGSGMQTLTWKPAAGEWRIVVMQPGAGRGVTVAIDVGARLEHLGALSLLVLGAGVLFGAASAALMITGTRRLR